MKKKLFILLLLLLTSSAVGQFQQKPMLGQQIEWGHPLAKDLVGYWLVNEGTGNIVQDLSGNGKIGTITGATWVSGKFGPCLSFDGANDNVSLPLVISTIITTTSKYTVTGWYNKAVVSIDKFTIFNSASGSTNSMSIQVQNDSLVAGHYNGSAFLGGRSSSQKIINTWHFFAYTYDAGTSTLTVDGEGSIGTNTPYTGTDAGVKIGENTQGSYDFDGLIDDLMIYNRALSTSEIAELYRNPFCMFEPTFYTWWGRAIGEEEPPVGNTGSPGGVKSGGKDGGKSAGKQN